MICAYESSAVDFTTNGLGPLRPIDCKVSETLNGMWELVMTHPLDEWGKCDRLAIGNIIRAPVPAGRTPAVKYVESGTGTTEVWKVNLTGTRLILRAEPKFDAKAIWSYRTNTEVMVLNKDNNRWYEVTTPDGKHGWMYSYYLTYVRTEASAKAAEESVTEPKELREQPFRIYKIVPGLDRVTVYARHVFYDLADNLLSECKPENVDGSTAAAMILSACRGAHEFKMYSDLEGSGSADWTDQTPVEAILGNEGLCETWGGELARDWWDVYAVQRVGRDTGIEIRQGKNLKSLGGEIDASSVVTRIVPIGTDADGNALYLPEIYVDSENVENLQLIKWGRLDVREAKEVRSGSSRKTKEQCYELMREAARAQFDAGIDAAAVTLDVDFINLADTVEYAEWAGVNDLALGDSVRIKAPGGGVDTLIRMTEYTYDCLKKRYETASFGALGANIASSGLTARQLPSAGVTASKIARNAVDSGHLQDGSVNSLKIALASIGYAHMQAATIQQLSADAISAQVATINALTAQTINTDTLAAAYAHLFELVADAITAGTITADTLTASMARLTQASIGRADIDWAQIRTATIEQLITRDAVADRYFIDKLQVRNLQVVEQTVGSLIIKASNGSYYRLDVDAANGSVTPVMVTPSAGEIAAGVTSDGNRSIIETDLTVADLSASSVKAINALIDKITADRIDVDKLFARQAVIGALQTADISGNESLQFAVTGGLNTGDDAGVKVLITKDRFSINVQGGEEEVVLNESGAVMRNVTVTEELNAPKLLKIFPGGDYSIGLPPAGDTRSYVHVYSTVADFVRDVAYKTLDGFTTVYLNKDISEGMTLIGLSGIRLCIKGNAHDWFGTMRFSSCSCGEIAVENTKIHATASGSTLVYVDGCHYVNLNNVSFYGHLKASTMVQYLQGSHGMVIDCGFYDDAGNNCTGIFAAYATNVYIQNQKGGVHNPFIGSGCSACWVGTRALGTIAYGAPCLLNPTDLASLPTDPGESGGGGDTEPVTITYYAAQTRNCRGTGTWDSTSYAQTGITQNYYNSSYYKGCIWFDIDASVYAGKTIKSISLRLYRPSSGYGTTAEIAVKIIGLTFTYQQNLQQVRTLPNATTGSIYTSNYYIDSTYSTFVEIGKIGRNQQMDFELPLTDGFVQNLLTNGGLALFGGETTASSGHNYSNNYGQFAGAAPTNGAEYAPQLLITYV